LKLAFTEVVFLAATFLKFFALVAVVDFALDFVVVLLLLLFTTGLALAVDRTDVRLFTDDLTPYRLVALDLLLAADALAGRVMDVRFVAVTFLVVFVAFVLDFGCAGAAIVRVTILALLAVVFFVVVLRLLFFIFYFLVLQAQLYVHWTRCTRLTFWFRKQKHLGCCEVFVAKLRKKSQNHALLKQIRA
jgi:hypothetical protein